MRRGESGDAGCMAGTMKCQLVDIVDVRYIFVIEYVKVFRNTNDACKCLERTGWGVAGD